MAHCKKLVNIGCVIILKGSVAGKFGNQYPHPSNMAPSTRAFPVRWGTTRSVPQNVWFWRSDYSVELFLNGIKIKQGLVADHSFPNPPISPYSHIPIRQPLPACLQRGGVHKYPHSSPWWRPATFLYLADLGACWEGAFLQDPVASLQEAAAQDHLNFLWLAMQGHQYPGQFCRTRPRAGVSWGSWDDATGRGTSSNLGGGDIVGILIQSAMTPLNNTPLTESEAPTYRQSV